MSFGEIFLKFILPQILTGVLGFFIGRTRTHTVVCRLVYRLTKHEGDEYHLALKMKCSATEEAYHRGRWDAATRIYADVAAQANVDVVPEPKTYKEEIGNDEEAVQKVSVEDIN